MVTELTSPRVGVLIKEFPYTSIPTQSCISGTTSLQLQGGVRRNLLKKRSTNEVVTLLFTPVNTRDRLKSERDCLSYVL